MTNNLLMALPYAVSSMKKLFNSDKISFGSVFKDLTDHKLTWIQVMAARFSMFSFCEKNKHISYRQLSVVSLTWLAQFNNLHPSQVGVEKIQFGNIMNKIPNAAILQSQPVNMLMTDPWWPWPVIQHVLKFFYHKLWERCFKLDCFNFSQWNVFTNVCNNAEVMGTKDCGNFFIRIWIRRKM